ncbi:MAG: T9SS type A sorting domain-containing protein [Bacteroidota bacterium]|nr:T9SS type A sorting domain-containing protein [Bacteroidota bacterium]
MFKFAVSLISAPSTPGVITGEAYGLCIVNGILYSVQAVPGASYNWSFNSVSGTVASGQGTNSITANLNSAFSLLSLSVTASNACGTSNARTLTLRSKPATPGAISGPLSVCANQQGVPYSITPVFGAASYTWTGPKKSKISDGVVLSTNPTLLTNSNNVTVNYGASGGTLRVRANNSCGSGAYRSVTISISCREGLFQYDPIGFEVAVFPNPASTELNIETASETFEVILYNSVGQQMLHVKDQSKIDVSSYPPRMYLLKIVSGSSSVTKKILLEQ